MTQVRAVAELSELNLQSPTYPETRPPHYCLENVVLICQMDSPSGDSVFTLLTDLCKEIVSKDATVPPSKVSKLRSQAYEIILSEKSKPLTPPTSSPIMNLLHCYYVQDQDVKTVAQYKNKEKLKEIIDNLLKTEQEKRNENFHNVLKLLVSLSSTEKDFSEENYQNPFNYGVTDLMNPKPKLEFGLAQPFPCYPPHMFQLPFTLTKQKESKHPYQCSTKYTVQNFGPWSYLPAELRQDIAELKTFTSPMMLASLTSSHCTPYSNPVLDSRLSGPRDLSIPGLLPANDKVPQVTLNSATSLQPVEVEEMYRASDATLNTGVEIWDLASRLDKYIPDDIWEIAAKMSQEDCSQRGQKQDFSRAHALTEQQFLYIITGLAFGVESVTSSVQAGMLFEINNCLVILFEWELNELKALGLYHKRIYDFAFNQRAKESVINLAARAALVEYVIEFRAKLLDALSRCGEADQWVSFVVHKMSPLTKEVIFIGNLLRVRGADILLLDSYATMSYLSKEIMKPLNGSYSASVAKILVAICKVYFKFIERFIFESSIEDHSGDFFIESNLRCEQSRTSDFWNGVFRFSRRIKVPDFLKNLSKSIMLCGKTLRLLKICKSNDPLLHLISTDYPKIRCCTSYEQLAGRRQELDVYRSRCRFVTGQPVTLEHILLEKEAERQACAELAALKQAETIDRIAAERKRLVQLLVAEKKHSLRVLKAAMQEAKASKEHARGRARSARELEAAAQAASDDVDTWIRDTEKKEMMEYYSKLSGEVGKSKMHTEWRFKRLELNQRRVELLMSEERSEKRVRSELSTAPDVFLHGCDTPATPTAATPTAATPTSITPVVSVGHCDDVPNAPIKINLKLAYDGSPTVFSPGTPTNVSPHKFAVPAAPTKAGGLAVSPDTPTSFSLSQLISPAPPDASAALGWPISIIAPASTPSSLGVEKVGPSADTHFISPMPLLECGKNYSTQMTSTPFTTESGETRAGHLFTVMLDDQGNFIPLTSTKSSNVIGQDLNQANDNERFLETRKQAMRNKQAVMAHEFGTDVENNPSAPRLDHENNLAELTPTQEAIRNKMKVLGDEFNEAAPEARAAREPRTAAQREALINKQKVLGAEYHLPCENVKKRAPANVAQKEALINRDKAFMSDLKEKNDSTINASLQKSADIPVINISSESEDTGIPKISVINISSDSETSEANVPVVQLGSARDATYVKTHADPLVNKPTTTDTTYVKAPDRVVNKPTATDTTYVKAPTDRVVNKPTATDATYVKAPPDRVVNKPTTTDTTYVKAPPDRVVNKPTTTDTTYVKAPPDRVVNKPTTTDTTYVKAPDLPETPVVNRPIATDATYAKVAVSPNRAGLRLELPKPYNNTAAEIVATPRVAITTPVFSNTQLSVETPGCQDINLFKTTKTPDAEKSVELKLSYPHLNNGFLNLNEEVKEMMANEDASSLLMSPEKSLESLKNDSLNESSDFISIDPFGRRQISLGLEARAGDGPLRYTDYSELMKHPSKFFSLPSSQDDENEWNGMASLVCCLHESVHQPLVYQLEILNNSVLLHYLVNLDMYGHLCFLKDHFLLLDGCFSGSLCNNLFARLAGAACPAELLNFASLDGMLDAALGYSESRDKYSDNLRLIANKPPLSIQHSSPDALQCLTLCYRVEWPLNIVLSAEAMQRYLRTFQFLLKMKRISWVLVQDFEYLKQRLLIPREAANKLRRSPHYVTLQNYRHIMATLVTALDNYITMSCLLASWREYVAELKKATTLDDLVTSHAAYIKKVQFRCLMNKRSTPVMQLINDIFTVILKYSRVLQAGHWHSIGGPYEHENFDRLKDLFLIFKQLWTYLHKVVSQLRECNYQPELFEDLMTTINFNGYIAEVKPKEKESKKPRDYHLDDLTKKKRYKKTRPS